MTRKTKIPLEKKTLIQGTSNRLNCRGKVSYCILMAWILSDVSFSETFCPWWKCLTRLISTKKPYQWDKCYKVLNQNMKRSGRTFGSLALVVLEKLILYIVSYGWFKWLFLNTFMAIWCYHSCLIAWSSCKTQGDHHKKIGGEEIG